MASAERAIAYAIQKLGQLVIDESVFLSTVRADVEWMQFELRLMCSFLEDADAKGRDGDNRTKTWIRELTKVANEAEDVVDTFMLQIDAKNRQRTGCFQRYTCIPCKLVDLHYIGTEILLIKTKIQDISGRKDRYGIIELDRPSDSAESIRTIRNLHPELISGNEYFVGFGGHKKLILERLIDPKVKKYAVIPIVGMGGSGKTTLATMIYNSHVAKDWFPYHAWVTVSEEFKPLELLRNLIKQVEGDFEKYKDMDTVELKVQVHDCLKKQRYLIVLDDIWGQGPDALNQLKDVFPDVENGSRVLITTRSIGIARYVDPSNEPNELPPLDETESWELFLNVVFPSKDGSEPKCPEALENLGRDLVKKCGGLPLGVKILGGLLLVTERTMNAWNNVAAKWNHQNKSLKHLQILALSYNNLPNVNMKSCFLYIGNYPEYCVIKASKLTKFWIAEGFILKDENQTFEETANDYLDEFVLRCMIQVVDRTRTSNRVKHFRIHQLFREWCISEAQEDGFFRICTSNSDTSDHEIVDARRLAIYKSTLDDKFYDLSYKARAILGFDYLSVSNFFLGNIGQNFKLLRVIYLNFQDDMKIHKSKPLKKISKLIHLRNITLVSKALTYLPSSTGKLHNLQTLNIKNTGILNPPATLYQIHSLRHLYTSGITIGPSVDWNLRNLQTLDSIKAGSWMLKDFAKLLNLRKLSIFGITKNEVRLLHDSLYELNHLNSLRLESDDQPATSLFTSFKSHNPLSKLVLINWSHVSSEFPQNLTTIRLSGCRFEKGVIASLEKLPGLANLSLKDCGIDSEDEFVFSANGFHHLEKLHIDEMRSLLDWRIENGALPKIIFMMIRASDWLAKLPDGLERLRSLRKLEILFPKENLIRRLLETMEDRHRIPQITYVTLNGIKLDHYKRSTSIISSNGVISFDDDEPILSTGEGKHRSVIRGKAVAKFLMDMLPENVDKPKMEAPMAAPKMEAQMAPPKMEAPTAPPKVPPKMEAPMAPPPEMEAPMAPPKMEAQMAPPKMEAPMVPPKMEAQMAPPKMEAPMAPKKEDRKKEERKAESSNKQMLEMLRTYRDHDRPGMDIVTVLDVSWNNSKLLNSVMNFLIRKLGWIDRMSIIISSSKPMKLCSLRQTTESALDDFKTLINNLIFDPDRNISAGIQMGLEVINGRRFTTGRLAAIMLMSDDGALNEYNTAQVQLGNVPVCIFALGAHYNPKEMNEISQERLGATFFTIRNIYEASLSFTQCFARLFAGKYRPSTDNASSSSVYS